MLLWGSIIYLCVYGCVCMRACMCCGACWRSEDSFPELPFLFLPCGSWDCKAWREVPLRDEPSNQHHLLIFETGLYYIACRCLLLYWVYVCIYVWMDIWICMCECVHACVWVWVLIYVGGGQKKAWGISSITLCLFRWSSVYCLLPLELRLQLCEHAWLAVWGWDQNSGLWSKYSYCWAISPATTFFFKHVLTFIVSWCFYIDFRNILAICGRNIENVVRTVNLIYGSVWREFEAFIMSSLPNHEHTPSFLCWE